jgi:hypothetical protein
MFESHLGAGRDLKHVVTLGRSITGANGLSIPDKSTRHGRRRWAYRSLEEAESQDTDLKTVDLKPSLR